MRTLQDLKPEQWIEIRRIALEFCSSGFFGEDQMKCSIAAFMEWLTLQEEGFQIGVEVDGNLH